jgi:hypothetical protein
MKFLKITLGLFLLFCQFSNAQEPIKYSIRNSKGLVMNVVGHLGDLLNISYDSRVLYQRYPESRELQGGSSIAADDIIFEKNTALVRYGRNDDMIMLFAFEYDINGRLSKIYRYFWPCRDGSRLPFGRSDEGDYLVTFGNKHDLHKRFSFNWSDKKWWCNSNYRDVEGFPAVDISMPTEIIIIN